MDLTLAAASPQDQCRTYSSTTRDDVSKGNCKIWKREWHNGQFPEGGGGGVVRDYGD